MVTTKRKIKVYATAFGIPAVAVALFICGFKTAAFIIFNIWFVPFVAVMANWPRIKAYFLKTWDEIDREMAEKGLTRKEYFAMKRAQRKEELEKRRKKIEAMEEELKKQDANVPVSSD